MTRVVISQPMYFPWAGFLAQMALADVFIWLDDAQFSKGSFTNRVQVKTGAGRKWMSIPLDGKGAGRRIRDLQPARADWADGHVSLLRNALADAPFRDEVLEIVLGAAAADSLCDAIIASAELSAAAAGVRFPPALRSSDMGVPGSGWERVLKLVQKVGGTSYITGHGARNYLDHLAFEAAGVPVAYMDYAPHPWPQAHGPFTPYVTGLDLVANVPPDHRAGHLNPRTVPWRAFADDQGKA